MMMMIDDDGGGGGDDDDGGGVTREPVATVIRQPFAEGRGGYVSGGIGYHRLGHHMGGRACGLSLHHVQQEYNYRYSISGQPRYRLVCICFPTPGRGLPYGSGLGLSRCLGPGECLHSFISGQP